MGVWNSSKWFQMDSGGRGEGDNLGLNLVWYVKDFGFYPAGVEREMKVFQSGKGSWSDWHFRMVSQAAVWRTDSRGRKLKTRRSVGIQVREGGRSKEVEWNQHGGPWGVRERWVHENAYCFGSRVVLTHWERQERNVRPTCQRSQGLEIKSALSV